VVLFLDDLAGRLGAARLSPTVRAVGVVVVADAVGLDERVGRDFAPAASSWLPDRFIYG